MTELLGSPFDLPQETEIIAETPELRAAVRYCADHYRQTAREVVRMIEESDYAYGIDSYCDKPPYFDKSDQIGWKVHEYDVTAAYRQAAKATIYLIEDGQMVIQAPDDFYTYTKQYIPTMHGEPPMTTIAVYANLVGLVEDQAFRERHLAFLEA